MSYIIILKNTHFPVKIPWNLFPRRAKKNKKFSALFKFDNSIRYCDTEDNPLGNDCLDWCKLTGISYKPTTNAMKNSMMLAFRYVADIDKVELGIYTHSPDGTREMPSSGKTIFLPIGQYGKVVFDENKITLGNYSYSNYLTLINGVDYHTTTSVQKGKWVREIGSWFGGNRPAPQTIKFWLRTWWN